MKVEKLVYKDGESIENCEVEDKTYLDGFLEVKNRFGDRFFVNIDEISCIFPNVKETVLEFEKVINQVDK